MRGRARREGIARDVRDAGRGGLVVMFRDVEGVHQGTRPGGPVDGGNDGRPPASGLQETAGRTGSRWGMDEPGGQVSFWTAGLQSATWYDDFERASGTRGIFRADS